MAEQQRPFISKVSIEASRVMFPNAHQGDDWPFGDSEPDMMDGIGPIRPDAFDEPSPEAKAAWERNARPIIDQIAPARAEG